MVKVRETVVSSLLSVSKIPGAEFAVNPYIGCAHKCAYCYAEFMKRYSERTEPWGDFMDVKRCRSKFPFRKIEGHHVLMSSVTDAYTPVEAKIGATRRLLELFLYSQCQFNLTVLTKGALILRDTDLLKPLRARICISLSSLDSRFQTIFEPRASSPAQRIGAIQELHARGFSVSLYLSPFFPGLSDFRSIIEATRNWADHYVFMNLNLRDLNRSRILNLIGRFFPEQALLYRRLYIEKDHRYWYNLASEIQGWCRNRSIPHKILFHP